nr:hypothetical protein [uncultured Vibrio sp.]
MAPRSKHVWNGIVGLVAIAESIGAAVPTIRRRLHKGLTLDEAIDDIQKSRAKVNKVRELNPYQPKPKSNRTPCKFPDQLSELWCLALGIKTYR